MKLESLDNEIIQQNSKICINTSYLINLKCKHIESNKLDYIEEQRYQNIFN